MKMVIARRDTMYTLSVIINSEYIVYNLFIIINSSKKLSDSFAIFSKQWKSKCILKILFYRYRVVVPYPPQSEAELELKEGDVVFVHKKHEDGWFKGTLQRNGKTGLFPGSFVESI